METGMIVISAILIIICTLPFLIINGSTRKRKTQLKNALKNGILQNNGVMSDFATNSDFAIGIDKIAKHIYFYKKNQTVESFQKIDLKEIESCEVKKTTKRIKDGKSNFELIQNIAFVFNFKTGHIVEYFEIYDYDENVQLTDEIVMAESWKDKVNELLKSNTANSNTSGVQNNRLAVA